MILIDTSIWIPFLKQEKPVSDFVLYLIESQEVVTIELVFAELLQGARNQKERQLINAYYDCLPHLEEKNLLLKAGEMSSVQNLISKGLGLIDSALIYLAKSREAQVWTLDKALKKELAHLSYEPRLQA